MKRSVWLVLCLMLFTSSSLYAQIPSVQLMKEANQFYNTKDYADALNSYLAVAKLDPTNSAAYQGIGNCHFIMGMKQDALTAYQTSLQLQPNNPPLSALVLKLQKEVVPMPAIPTNSVQPSVPTVPQQSTLPQLPVDTDSGFYIRLGSGADFGSNMNYSPTNPEIIPGVVQTQAGYRLDHYWAIQLEYDNLWSLDYYGDNVITDRLLGEVKMAAGPGNVQVYGLVGAGVDLDTFSYGGYASSQGYFDFLFGAGMQVRIGKVFGLYLEGKCNFTTGSYSSLSTDFPITSGIGLNF